MYFSSTTYKCAWLWRTGRRVIFKKRSVNLLHRKSLKIKLDPISQTFFSADFDFLPTIFFAQISATYICMYKCRYMYVCMYVLPPLTAHCNEAFETQVLTSIATFQELCFRETITEGSYLCYTKNVPSLFTQLKHLILN
jgi:hypothetical protein